MEWLPFAAFFLVVTLTIVVLAKRAPRPAAGQPTDQDDPHAGLLREVAGQEGPKIYPP